MINKMTKLAEDKERWIEMFIQSLVERLILIEEEERERKGSFCWGS